MARRDVLLIVVSDVLALELANLHVVERDVVLQVLVLDQAVISNDRHMLRGGFVYDHRGGLAVMRRHDEDAVAFSQVGFRLAVLRVLAAIGIHDIYCRAREVLLNRLHDQRMVLTLPASRGIALREQEADLLAAFGCSGRPRRARATVPTR